MTNPTDNNTDAATAGLFYVSIDNLRFDPLNPRFVEFQGGDEAALIKFLYDEVDLSELLQSIATSGYISFEPLIVLKEAGHFTVLEGNRRLAAVKLLRSKELQAKVGVIADSLNADALATTEKLLVKEVADRREARAFIGFKHINGPHRWDSLAKAKYAADWLKEPGVELSFIARTLGDGYSTVRRLVLGWFVLQQAERNGFQRDNRFASKFAFSHLYTALARPGYRAFLGLPDVGDAPLAQDPVPSDHLSQLKQLMTWLYGDRSEDVPPLVRSQNPDLNRLNDVLEHPEARQYVMAGQSLEAAFRVIAPRSRRFADALIGAVQGTKEALSLVPEYDRDPSLLDNARSLERTGRTLVRTMEELLAEPASA